MRVLVTGGAGFIGSALVRFLVKNVGVEVLTIDKLTYAGNLSSLSILKGASNHHFLKADICDSRKIAEVFENFHPEYLVHLAAESHVDRSIANASDFIHTNVNGTYVLLEAARKYWEGLSGDKKLAFKMLHVSTDEVYGSLDGDGLFTETTSYDPSSPYSASKAASDHLATAWCRTYGLPVVISNCSNNYGPYHFPEKLIPLLTLKAIEGKELPLYGNGSNVRDWLYVEDHVKALWLILRKGLPGQKYNVGGHNERQNIEVANAVCNVLDDICPKDHAHSELITFVADRPGHDERYAIDPSKLENELGWKAEETFDTGIRKTVQWYLYNEWWWRPLRQKTYNW